MGFRRPLHTKSKRPHASIPHTSYLVKQRLYACYGLLSLTMPLNPVEPELAASINFV
ncbi:hypothetical protein NEIMUCOT_04893 [Neisseria mucosa ATCC 25996]|uniref:Uncharacterized protein n=1 Tax=Neisseria mucosa (strain ATCC 25996 / DSM 4631 / NCTC 10774 / M26) TaxID=546266 RepID=D2ZWA0_NEIM2|nr:hypothetical protein NEIMUCOT_04893 [Neisseria mucosa ATCC 25996]